MTLYDLSDAEATLIKDLAQQVILNGPLALPDAMMDRVRLVRKMNEVQRAPPNSALLVMPLKTIDRLDRLIDLAQVPPNHDDQAAHNIAETMRVMLWENRQRGFIPQRTTGGPAA